MMENKGKETFHYIYSAKQQEEIQTIRNKYLTHEEDKMEQLRKLDYSVTKKATTDALIVGIVGALLLGIVMSFVMTNLSEVLGLLMDYAMLIGIVIGLMGIVLVCLAYPIYSNTIKRERERMAPEILRLTDELMKP